MRNAIPFDPNQECNWLQRFILVVFFVEMLLVKCNQMHNLQTIELKINDWTPFIQSTNNCNWSKLKTTMLTLQMKISKKDNISSADCSIITSSWNANKNLIEKKRVEWKQHIVIMCNKAAEIVIPALQLNWPKKEHWNVGLHAVQCSIHLNLHKPAALWLYWRH